MARNTHLDTSLWVQSLLNPFIWFSSSLKSIPGTSLESSLSSSNPTLRFHVFLLSLKIHTYLNLWKTTLYVPSSRLYDWYSGVHHPILGFPYRKLWQKINYQNLKISIKMENGNVSSAWKQKAFKRGTYPLLRMRTSSRISKGHGIHRYPRKF